jgi:hypothetical protein
LAGALARLTKSGGSLESAQRRSGTGTRFTVEAALAKLQEAAKLTREKRWHEQQRALQPRRG